ncbi:hypothetical protein [Flavobacterium sp.]|uniref:hypothetical protein n=1 Tax=Flavobacterium sp. TaxID=239 RepID=UPI0026311865|nr:hypothetical protein [Flavobacterium sp.]
MNKITVFFLTVFFAISCKNSNEKLTVSDVKFQSIFGIHKKDPKQVFCLLGTNFFRAKRSENTDQLIEKWIYNHPKAEVVPVSSGELMTYCLLVDQKETINEYLVRNGCFEGRTMIRPQFYDEMSSEMKKNYPKDTKEIVHLEKAK